jgi:hypothetical protein
VDNPEVKAYQGERFKVLSRRYCRENDSTANVPAPVDGNASTVKETSPTEQPEPASVKKEPPAGANQQRIQAATSPLAVAIVFSILF